MLYWDGHAKTSQDLSCGVQQCSDQGLMCTRNVAWTRALRSKLEHYSAYPPACALGPCYVNIQPLSCDAHRDQAGQLKYAATGLRVPLLW